MEYQAGTEKRRSAEQKNFASAIAPPLSRPARPSGKKLHRFARVKRSDAQGSARPERPASLIGRKARHHDREPVRGSHQGSGHGRRKRRTHDRTRQRPSRQKTLATGEPSTHVMFGWLPSCKGFFRVMVFGGCGHVYGVCGAYDRCPDAIHGPAPDHPGGSFAR